MAEAPEQRRRAREHRRRPEPAESRRTLNAAEVARLAVQQVGTLTGREPEGVTKLEPSDDGWLVGVEVVESRRIPDSTDVMAVYEIELDRDAELVGYRRVDRYSRGHGNP